MARKAAEPKSQVANWTGHTARLYATVDIGRQTRRLAEEELSLLSPGEGPRVSSLVVAEDQVIPVQCEG
jgi:hypothetical protein